MKAFKEKQLMQTTQEILQGAMARIGQDVDALNAKRDEALGIFNQTHCKLCAINEELQQSVQQFREIADYASKQALVAETAMKSNNHVCEQIRSIVGNDNLPEKENKAV